MCIMAVPLPARADNKAISDSLEIKLSKLTTPEDSIKILYDLFDLAPRSGQAPIAEMLYVVAMHSGNTAVQLDALRLLANRYLGNDSLQETVQWRVATMPESKERNATEMFIKLSRIATQANSVGEDIRANRLHEALKNYTTGGNFTADDEIELLFSICIYMETLTHGDLLTQYLDKLGMLIQDESYTLDALLAQYYTRAAVSYSYNDDYAKAIEADRQLLSIMNRLKHKYNSQGRIYRNYDVNKYICYRRILSNYPALSPEEVDSYYGKIMSIAERNDEVTRDMANNDKVKIYYLMAKGHYAEAIPLLKQRLQTVTDKKDKRKMLKALIRAATQTGDNKSLLDASVAYNRILEEYVDSRSAEKYRELQILYDLNDLRNRNTELEIAHRDSELSFHRTMVMLIIVIGSIIVVILLISSMILAHMYKKSKRLSANLSTLNDNLREERDTLKRTQQDLIRASEKARQAERHKTEFINNMSHEVATPLNAIVEYSQLIVDCIDDGKRPYLDKFAKTVKLNTDLLLTLVNDVLEIAAMDNTKIKLSYSPVSVQLMCDVALGSIKNRIAPGVKVVFKQKNDADKIVNTDRQRVVQVLMNLLSNAAKFTESGCIELAYQFNEDSTKLTFSVTDTGIGIPKGMESRIFERFEKLNKQSQGIGLGLPICKMVAQLMGGNVTVDTSYSGLGSRFLFTIPVN